MTRKHPTEFEQLELRWPCHQCHRQPGEWCITTSGRATQYLHSSRFYTASRYLDQMRRQRMARP